MLSKVDGSDPSRRAFNFSKALFCAESAFVFAAVFRENKDVYRNPSQLINQPVIMWKSAYASCSSAERPTD